MLRRTASAFLVASLTAFAAACSSYTSPSKNTVETRSGTIAVGGSAIENFTVKSNGEISIIVSALSPTVPTSTFFGVGYGLQSSGQCALFGVNLSVVGATAISTSITPGNYCVQIVDQGAFTTTETYTLLISHP